MVSTEPYIMTFDNFMNESETEALIHAVGAESGGPGFVRSTDTGAYNKVRFWKSKPAIPLLAAWMNVQESA